MSNPNARNVTKIDVSDVIWSEVQGVHIVENRDVPEDEIRLLGFPWSGKGQGEMKFLPGQGTSKFSSGIQVKDECKTTFDEMKLGHKYSYIIYRISKDMKSIEVDCVGGVGESYDCFCEKLITAGNNAEGRYGVIDANYQPGKSSKLVFMMWLPDNQLGIKQKMIYSSSKKALRDKLQGVAKEMQCNDTDDLAWSAIVEKCQSKYD